MSNYPDNTSNEGYKHCPRCGTECAITDPYCRGCGHHLARPTSQIISKRPVRQPLPKYERKFSVPTRFVKLFTSPREAMQDISLAPDYAGAVVIIIMEVILTIAATALVLQKLQFTGPYASQLVSTMSSVIVVTIMIVPIIFGARWLVKSWLVKEMSDSNAWDFTSAAAVTGYAYLGSTILAILSVIIGWIFIPSIVVDTTNLELAIALMEQHNAELMTYQFMITFPLALIGMLWKSYLGGLGTNEGTRKVCSLEKGMTIFVLLGFLGLVIDFLL